MRQASRRSWRIGQKRPVKVVFMAYRNTLQADALKLVAKKLQSSLAVEGELPEDGLAAFGDDGDDLMLALARQIVSGEEETDADGESLEGGIRPGAGRRGQRRGVPGGRRLEGRSRPSPELEPVVLEVNGNGHHSNGNGPPRRHRGDGGAGPGQRPRRQRQRQRERNQRRRPPQRGPCRIRGRTRTRRGAAVPLLLGRVPGRGTGEVQGAEQPQTPARRRLPVRVGAGKGDWKKSRSARGARPQMRRERPPQTTTAASFSQQRRSLKGTPRRATNRNEQPSQRRSVMARVFVYDDREFPDPDPGDDRRAGEGDAWPTSTAKSPTPR